MSETGVMRRAARLLAACLLLVQPLPVSAKGPGISPIALATLGSGELLVLDSRRGLFVIDPRSGQVRALVSGFGAFGAADMAVSPSSQGDTILVSMGVPQPQGMLARVVRYNRAGKSTGEWGWFGLGSEPVQPGGLAIDAQRSVAYVVNSRRPSVYRFDLNRPGTRPAEFATIRGAKNLGPLVLDAKRSRLLVGDPFLGTVHAVDLASRKSQLLFRGLGEPYAFLIDTAGDRLFIADASGERVLVVGLTDKASAVTTFAKLSKFSDPHALAFGADGNLWVGDEDEETLLLVSPKGVLLRTISLD
ncbi:MAG: hypothetical protein ABUT39_21860 [Acidobacteriota bacterium]